MANKTTKFFAILALFGIIISVIWTALLIFFSWDDTSKQEVITKEQLQEMVNKQNIKLTASWVTN